MRKATLHYTPTLLRRATFAFVRRSFGTGGFIALGLVLLITGFSVVEDPGSWLTGVICGAAGVMSASLVGLTTLIYVRGMARLKRMVRPHAVLELLDDEFRVSSEGGTFTGPWSTFSDLWRFNDVWLLLIDGGQFLTLPLADLTPEVQEFIAGHVGKQPESGPDRARPGPPSD